MARNTNKSPYATTDIPYAPKSPITIKQVQVLLLQKKGYSQRAMAKAMGVSRRTIRQHINALKKRKTWLDVPLNVEKRGDTLMLIRKKMNK